MKKAWAVGLEEVSDKIDLSELENPVEGVEAKLVEAADCDSEVKELADDGESLSRDTEHLEKLDDVVSEAAGDEGEGDGEIDESTARVVDVAVEHFADRWGVERRIRHVGTESLSPSAKIKAKVAVESIGDAIKDAWSTFVQWLTEILNKLKDWWLKYVNAGKAIRDRANKLSDRLDNIGSRDKEKIKGSWIKDLAIDQHVDVDGVIAVANMVGSELEACLRTVQTRLNKAGEMVRARGQGKGATFIKTDSAEAAFGKKTTKNMSKLVPSGSTKVLVRALPGNAYVINYLQNDVSETRFFVAPAEGETNKSSAELPTPDVAKMKQACSAAAKVGDVLETRLKDFRLVNDEMSKLKEAAKSAAEAFKEAKAEERTAKKLAMREARAAVNSALVMNRAAVYGLKSAGTGLLGFVQAGIGAYKKTA